MTLRPETLRRNIELDPEEPGTPPTIVTLAIDGPERTHVAAKLDSLLLARQDSPEPMTFAWLEGMVAGIEEFTPYGATVSFVDPDMVVGRDALVALADGLAKLAADAREAASNEPGGTAAWYRADAQGAAWASAAAALSAVVAKEAIDLNTRKPTDGPVTVAGKEESK